MTQLVEQAREFVLDYFNASPDEYCVIFTPNASGALKLVGEAYPFAPGDQYLLTFDNHNSVNGIREFARARGATVTYSPVTPPDLRIDEDRAAHIAGDGDSRRGKSLRLSSAVELLRRAAPAGVDRGGAIAGLGCAAGCAAFAPTNRLDLSRWKPDFVPLSFYKMFGYPTGVGALIARKAALEKLHRPWFAGGTITISSVQGDGYYLAEGQTAFEDGTINYLTLPAVEIGLKYLAGVGVETIHERVVCLTGWLLDQLTALRHSNGQPLVRVYGPTTTEGRGGTITVNFIDSAGKVIDHRVVEDAASKVNISLRTGCFCNPGAGENALGLTAAELKDCFQREERMTFEQFIVAMSQKDVEAVGAVRVSLGIASNFADAYRFMAFATTLLDTPAGELTD